MNKSKYALSPPGLKPAGPLYYRNTKEGFFNYYVVWVRAESYPYVWQEVKRYKQKARAQKLLDALRADNKEV